MTPRSRPMALLLLAGTVLMPPEGAVAGGESGLPVFSDQVAAAITAPTLQQEAKGFFGGGSISGFYATPEPGHLLMITPPGEAVVGRRLDQPLTALPRLRWSWRRLPLPPGGVPENLAEDAPMRIIIGFTAGGGAAVPAGFAKGRGLPPYDHALMLVWSNDSWEKGAADRHGPVARFIAHGGPADGQWWEQTVDLADLFGRLWPESSPGQAHIGWIAVALRGSQGETLGEVAGLTLLP